MIVEDAKSTAGVQSLSQRCQNNEIHRALASTSTISDFLK